MGYEIMTRKVLLTQVQNKYALRYLAWLIS
jgi:hypothetical protein